MRLSNSCPRILAVCLAVLFLASVGVEGGGQRSLAGGGPGGVPGSGPPPRVADQTHNPVNGKTLLTPLSDRNSLTPTAFLP